jgi:hypothetical protein
MTLGDPHTGTCTAEGAPAAAGRVRTCCNAGYARHACPSFPGGDAPDAVRFNILRRKAGLATLQYVVERDHHPFEHGTLELRETAVNESGESTLQRQARAFLQSYLRRTV